MARRLEFSPNDALALVEYNHTLFDRFVRRIRRLPPRAGNRHRGIGHESLFRTLVHILQVQEVWLVYIVRGRSTDPELEALFQDPLRQPKTWKEFDAYAERVWAGVNATARGLSRRALRRTVSAFWMPGRYTVRDAIYQATMEEAHHLGEIIGALRQEHRVPPEMTWIEVRRAPRRRSGLGKHS
jgi:uncharacterized damage-inducible protein DinB